MADASKSIQVNISVVVDQAKSALGQLGTTVTQATASLEKMGTGAKTGFAGVVDGAEKAKASTGGFFDTTTAGVLKGIASYDLLRKSVGLATDFIGDSIRESMDAAATMAIVENNVKNAGLSYDEIGTKLKAYSEAQIKMGFDDEATSLSVSKLLLITKDYSQALSLNQLAMDLARSKGIDLGTATKAIALVTQGNVRALKEYGIELGEDATIADVLTEAHNKLSGSAAAFAGTTAGRLAAVTEEWHNMEQAVGDALTPKLEEMFNTVEQNMPEIQSFFVALAEILGVVGDAVGLLIKPFQILGFAIGNTMNLIEGLPLANFNDLMLGSSNATTKLSSSLSGANANFDAIGKGSKTAAKDLAQAKQDAQNLADALDKVKNKQSEFSFAAEADFSRFKATIADASVAQAKWITQTTQGFDALKSTIKSTTDQIGTLEQKLAAVDNGLADFTKSTTKSAGDSFAQIVFNAQKDIAELPQKIADAASKGQDTTELSKQLADARAVVKDSLDQRYQSNVEYQSQLALLEKQAGESSLAAAYDEMQKKIADKMAEAIEESKIIQGQIDAARKKKDALEQFEKETTDAFALQVKNRQKSISGETAGLSTITAAASNAAAAYNALAAAQARTLNAMPSFSTQTSTPMQARASGGPVTGGETYLVGEQGPELFTPGVSGGITPNDKVSAGGGSIIININNPSVRSDNDLKMITKDVMDALSRRDELARFGAYK